MKKLLTIGAILTVLVFVQSEVQAELIADSVADFNDTTQGLNNWYYAGVATSGGGNLRDNSLLANAAPASDLWWAEIAGIGNPWITQYSQSMVEGAGAGSVRYWVADKDYENVTITTSVSATVTSNLWIVYSDADLPGSSQVALGNLVTWNGLESSFNADWNYGGAGLSGNISAGDAIYFLMVNSGDGQGSDTLSGWTVQINAVPEPATMALLGIGALVAVIKRNK